MFRFSTKLRTAIHPAIRTAIFPGRYVQGPGALSLLGSELKNFGKSTLVVSDPFASKTMSGVIKASIGTHMEGIFETFQGECCDDEIERLMKRGNVDVIAGIGGGKTLDTAKAVAYYLKKPVAIIPTLASADAPCTALTVIYTKSGAFDRYIFLPQNPNLVLVDSTVIAKAPVRFLVAGMGDALATYFEAASCFKTNNGNLTNYMGCYTAQGLARMCLDTLLEYGVLAKKACEAQTPCPPLERVIEANILLSGLGAESGGLAAAHAIHNGLTALPETHHYYHGEKVAVGLQASLFITDAAANTVDTVFSFCESVGLPTTLADIGVSACTEEQLLQVGALSVAKEDTMHNEAGVITAEAVAAGLRAADAYGRSRKRA